MKINKKKIVCYTASTLLMASLVSGVGLSIQDTTFDHTNKICPLTSLISIFDYDKAMEHQRKSIEQDYRDKGISASTAFYENYKEEPNANEYPAFVTVVPNSTGEQFYFEKYSVLKLTK